MFKLKVGTVPEHFAVPLFLGKQYSQFERENISLEIIEYPKGTGSMVHALKEGEVDVIIALTEGLIADKINNKTNFKILGTYVQSPLEWAAVIHPDDNSIQSLSDLKDKVFGISKFGSGSHIMSFVLAKENSFTITRDHFKVMGGIDDLINGVQTKMTDVFLWERLKQYVESNKVKYCGFIATPWPCFLIAARDDFISNHTKEIQHLLKAIQESCVLFKQKKEGTIKQIIQKCTLNEEDANLWFKRVEFSSHIASVSKSEMEKTMDILMKCGVIEKPLDVKELIDEKITKIE